MNVKRAVLSYLALISVGLMSCGPESIEEPVLYIGGIPDQNTAVLVRRFDEIRPLLKRNSGYSG